MNLPYRILLVTRRDNHGGAHRIITEIERNKLYRVTVSETVAHTTEALNSGIFQCLAYNIESFGVKKIHLISNIRDLGHTFPIIVFANYVDQHGLDAVRKIPRTVIIEKPFEPKDVWGICEKLLQGRKVNQRIFRRYRTHQRASMERSAGGGEIIRGNILNMSRGGVYFEMPEEQKRVAPGDIFKVSISLDILSKFYNVDAEVIWSAPRGHMNENPAVGLRFIQAGDVYRNLLGKL